jgi:hypothetical protein
MFHGLTASQGDQIASYIRSLNLPNPGRPWNPPYQPGPGLDSQPVEQWAAGAGLDAVLDSDATMMNYLMPSGSTLGLGLNANLNPREIPTSLQFLDWNSWLPGTFPLDAWGSSFTSSQLYSNYMFVRSKLQPGNATAYQAEKTDIDSWNSNAHNYLYPLIPAANSTSWTKQLADEAYATQCWSMVKMWEITQEFELEGMAQAVFGTQADSRAWYSQLPFRVSPALLGIPYALFDNGQYITLDYTSLVWYHLQMVLNNGNGHFSDTYPYDAPYSLNRTKDVNFYASDRSVVSLGPLTTLWLAKILQQSQYDAGPDKGSFGWQPNANDVSRLVAYSNLIWNNVPPSMVTTALQTYLTNWLS